MKEVLLISVLFGCYHLYLENKRWKLQQELYRLRTKQVTDLKKAFHSK